MWKHIAHFIEILDKGKKWTRIRKYVAKKLVKIN